MRCILLWAVWPRKPKVILKFIIVQPRETRCTEEGGLIESCKSVLQSPPTESNACDTGESPVHNSIKLKATFCIGWCWLIQQLQQAEEQLAQARKDGGEAKYQETLASMGGDPHSRAQEMIKPKGRGSECD